MTDVSAITSAAQSAGGTNSSKPSNEVDYQSFLRLLVAQMENQDPLAPMESTEYVAQLATFSQVEQSIQMNKKLDNMLQVNTLSQATGLIGKEIESGDGEVRGVVAEVELYSDGVMAVLADGTEVEMTPGFTIREAPVGGQDTGEQA